jgi:hypothetical protein
METTVKLNSLTQWLLTNSKLPVSKIRNIADVLLDVASGGVEADDSLLQTITELLEDQRPAIIKAGVALADQASRLTTDKEPPRNRTKAAAHAKNAGQMEAEALARLDIAREKQQLNSAIVFTLRKILFENDLRSCMTSATHRCSSQATEYTAKFSQNMS